MRRFVYVGALVTAMVLAATPVSAQTGERSWFVNAAVGPSFGTLGVTPAIRTSAGIDIGRGFSLIGEFGTLQAAPLDRASTLAPSVSQVVPDSDTKANFYHANLNLDYQLPAIDRLSTNLTAGIGTFTGSTIVSGTIGPAHVLTYRRQTHPVTNLGAGASFRLTDWVGFGADYRHFLVGMSPDRDPKSLKTGISPYETRHVNRFTAGLTFYVR